VNLKKSAGILAVVLMVLAAGLTLLTVLAMTGLKGGPGYFLYRSFHLAAFYVPLYLAVCGIILSIPDSCRKLLLGLNLSILPFLTLALMLHVISGNLEIYISRYLITELGLLISIPFLFLLLLVETALIYKGLDLLYPRETWFPADFRSLFRKTGDRLHSRFKPVYLRKEHSGRPEKFSEREAPSAGGEESAPAGGNGTFPFPDLPSPLEPVEAADDSEIQALISSVLRPEKTEPPARSAASARPAAAMPQEASPEEEFNPEKTLSISDIVEPCYDDEIPGDELPEADPGIDFLLNPHGMSGEDSLQEEVLPPFCPEEDVKIPGNIDAGEDLREEEDFRQEPSSPETPVIRERPVEVMSYADEDSDAEPDAVSPPAEAEEEDLSEEDYQAMGYVTDHMDDLTPWKSPDASEEDPAVDEPVVLVESAAPVSIEEKLSPEGETEKMGVLSKGLPPRHRRWQKYSVPVQGLLKEYPDDGFDQIDDHTRQAARALEETLYEFKIDAKVTGISKGPVITMFEIQPSPGVKVSRIVNLQDNLALRLAASRIRIVAPIPGKQAIGIEVPNRKRSIVSYRDLVDSDDFKMKDKYEIPVILGKDISGGDQVIDLARTPHLLIAGSTGSGKSVCVNSLICSILYKRSPRDVKLMMVDPKIVELKLYNDIPHLLTPVITEPKRAFQAVQWCLYEMERRYSLLDAMGVRDIKSYNKRIKERDIATTHLPYIVLVIDEFADLMATSGKELEGIVARLAAMSRAVGIHLVLATQRPSIDVITGLIKANFPSRIAFMVASKTDSRIIIDMVGAEKLLGKGDMLFTSAWDPFPSRVQGAFLSEDEVERVVSYVKTLGEPEYIDDEIFLDDEEFEGGEDSGGDNYSDPLYEKALEIVISAGKASASYLQRRLKIGYNRAARLVEEMEIRGIVGPQNGSKPREVVHIPDRSPSPSLDD